jgi:hypothetical protein
MVKTMMRSAQSVRNSVILKREKNLKYLNHQKVKAKVSFNLDKRYSKKFLKKIKLNF